MKLLKSLLTGLLILGGAGAATSYGSATDLYIAGSTAYRAPVTKAIQDVLGPNTYAWDGGSSANPLFKAGAAIISGTYSGTWYIVHTYWTGSLAGCIDLSATNPITKWIPDVVVTSGTALATGTNINGEYTAAPGTAPQIAMSDSYLSSVQASVKTANTGGTTFANAIAAASSHIKEAGVAALAANTVGIVPFVWVAGVQTSGTAPYNNMTQQNASQLETNGYLALSCLASSTSSSISNDTTDFAFLIGRNEDSGTRIGAQAESQINASLPGKSFGQPMTQFYVTFTNTNATYTSSAGGTITTDGSFPQDDTYANAASTPLGVIQAGGTNAWVADFGLWPSDAPLNTEAAVNWNSAGHSGQISGGDVAGVLEAENPLLLSGTSIGTGNGFLPANYTAGSSKAYFIGYLGTADALGIPSQDPVVYMSYNGVAYSPGAVLNGSYTFWTFEHMYYRNDSAPNAISGSTLTFANAIADKIFNQDAQTDSSGNTDTGTPPVTYPKVAGLLYNSSALYSRGIEGGPLSPNF